MRSCLILSLLPCSTRGYGSTLLHSRHSVSRGFALCSSAGKKQYDNNHVLALDFDGVICASAGESSHTAVAAAWAVWPQIPVKELHSTSAKAHLCKMLNDVRPLIETGYENVLLARYLSEHNDWSSSSSSLSQDKVVRHVLNSWSAEFRDSLLKQYAVDKSVLVKAFATARDAQIQSDLHAWVQKNKIYADVKSLLHSTKVDKSKTFIVTTKQERFVRAIFKGNQIDVLKTEEGLISNTDVRCRDFSIIDRTNIFDLENVFGSKANVLRHLLETFPDSHTRFHFVEDRLETLLNIVRLRESSEEYKVLRKVDLYLVDWGYNTAKQRQGLIESQSVIQVIDSSKFKQLLELVAL